ncbi:MAG: hypothetical protein ACFB0E_18435 [Leptolyngbyaceae cyanobacterium]
MSSTFPTFCPVLSITSRKFWQLIGELVSGEHSFYWLWLWRSQRLSEDIGLSERLT